MEKDENNKKGQRLYLIILTTITVIAILSNIVIVSLLIYDRGKNNNKDQNSQNVYQESDEEKYATDLNKGTAKELKSQIKNYMENGMETITLLRELFPENVVVYNADKQVFNKYLFLPINDNLAKNKINNESLKVLGSGEIQYQENGNVTSHKGIDVSRYQGEIDWEKVVADGVEFAIIRLGYRGYGTGVIVLDEKYEDNIKAATSAGVKVGVYFFSQAVTTEEAVEEAEFVLQNIDGYQLDYPIVYDTEEIVNQDSRIKGLTSEELSNNAIAFCERIKNENYTPMIYANLRWFTMSLDMSKLEPYEKWYAYYDSKLYFPYQISMWQYTESGQVDGIDGNVDLNISFEK